MSISKVSLPIAAVRDEYLKFKGRHGRFMQLADVYSNLNMIHQALFEYIESKSPVFGKKPNREVLMIAQAAVENSKVLLDIAEDEIARMRAMDNA
jgi:hypothetical protein